MHTWLAFIIVVGILVLAAAVAGATSFEANTQIVVALLIIAAVVAVIGAWLVYAAVKAQYKKVKTGEEALIGAVGVATTDLKPKGTVRVAGEFWEATTQGESISSGENVEVTALEGMFLVVKPRKH